MHRKQVLISTVLLLLIFIVTMVIFWKGVVSERFSFIPPVGYDEQDYDNIAYNLSLGRGFGLSWDDEVWIESYLHRNIRNRYKTVSKQNGWRPRQGPFQRTTYRPPGYPFLVSLVYRFHGRDFLMVRGVNVILISGTITLACGVALLLSGPGAALLTALLAIFDPVYMIYVKKVMTEPLAAFLIMVSIVFLLMYMKRPFLRWLVLSGISFGLLVLVRSMYVLWLPFLAAMVWVMGRSRLIGLGRTASARAVIVFLLFSVLVPIPWWFRNCVALQTFMPLGTQGGIGLPGSYSDVGYNLSLKGLGWAHPNLWAFFEPVKTQPGFTTWPALVQERELARYGQTETLKWLVNNPGKLPALTWSKIRLLMKRPDWQGGVTGLLALAGIVFMARRPETWLLFSFLIINIISLLIAYVTRGGRFFFPVHSIVVILAGIGIWQLLCLGKRRIRLARHGMGREEQPKHTVG